MVAKYTPSFAKNIVRRSLRSILDPHPGRSEIARVWAFFDSRCAYCGVVIALGSKYAHLDHLVPENSGGSNHISNRVPSCATCNEKEKREMDWAVFLQQKNPDPSTCSERERVIRDWLSQNAPLGQRPDSGTIALLNGEVQKVIGSYDAALGRIREYASPCGRASLIADRAQDRIAREFPNLYHFGPAANSEQIKRHAAIFSADLIRALAANTLEPPERRLARENVETPLGSFILNDQEALKYGHVKRPDSLPESGFVHLLDQLTFFWPGNDEEPIEMGRNFRDRYSKRGDKLLQVMVATRRFFAVNHPWRTFISTCNSGAPRSNPNAAIYRGYETFQPLLSYARSVKDIKEIAVLGYARLPDFRLTNVDGAAEPGAAPDLAGT